MKFLLKLIELNRNALILEFCFYSLFHGWFYTKFIAKENNKRNKKEEDEEEEVEEETSKKRDE